MILIGEDYIAIVVILLEVPKVEGLLLRRCKFQIEIIIAVRQREERDARQSKEYYELICEYIDFFPKKEAKQRVIARDEEEKEQRRRQAGHQISTSGIP